MDMHETAEELVASIDAAFSDIRRPAPHNLVELDNDDAFKELETPSIIEHFGGKWRHEFEEEVNSGHIEELTSMTDHAISYYLLCLLKKLLRDRDDFLFTIGMIGLLSNHAVKPNVDIWPKFTHQQRQCLFQTVNFVQQHIKSYLLGEFEEVYRQQLHEARKVWS